MEAKLYGLVLAGGKSTRMGKDKTTLVYRDKPHRAYLYDLLSKYCERVYVSVKNLEEANLEDGLEAIADSRDISTPLNGILSAFDKHPEAAWLVIASDLPMIDEPLIERLLESRDAEKIATAYATKASGKAEPLIAIWEPKSLTMANEFVEGGNMCPRKFLGINDTKLVHPENDDQLMNANSPEDFERAMELLANS